MTEPEDLNRAMERLRRSMRREIGRALEIGSPLPPLPSRDDPRYEAIAAWHRAEAFRTIDRHPDWIELRKRISDA